MPIDSTVPAWLQRRSVFDTSSQLQDMQFGAQLYQQVVRNQMAEKEFQLQAEAFRIKNEAMLQSHQGMVAMGQVMEEGANSDYTDPAWQAKFWGTAKKYPHLMDSPRFQDLLGVVKNSENAALRQDLALFQQEGRERLQEMRADAALDLEYERLQGRLKMQGLKTSDRIQIEREIAALNLVRDRLKPHPSGQSRFDLPYSQQLLMKRELDDLGSWWRELGGRGQAKPENQTKYNDRKKEIEDRYRAVAEEYQKYLRSGGVREGASPVISDDTPAPYMDAAPPTGDEAAPEIAPEISPEAPSMQEPAVSPEIADEGPAPYLKAAPPPIDDYQAYFDSIPPGGVFIHPDGTTRRKPGGKTKSRSVLGISTPAYR